MSYGLYANLPNGLAEPGYEEWNQILDSIRAALWKPLFLGGSLDTSHPGTSYQRVVGCVPFVVPSAIENGGVWKLRVFMVCEDAAVTITAKLRNVTDGTDVTGSTTGACSGTAADWSGTNQNALTGALTLTAGKVYELHAIKSANTKQCWIVGYLQRTDA